MPTIFSFNQHCNPANTDVVLINCSVNFILYSLNKMHYYNNCSRTNVFSFKSPEDGVRYLFPDHHRCNFSNGWGGGGAQRAKNVQGTIKILMEFDFSSNLTPFLTNIGG